MDKTIVVEVGRRLRHTRYQKFVSRKQRYLAHDKDNDCRQGDTVEIREHRPLSKNKRWILSRIIERAD